MILEAEEQRIYNEESDEDYIASNIVPWATRGRVPLRRKGAKREGQRCIMYVFLSLIQIFLADLHHWLPANINLEGVQAETRDTEIRSWPMFGLVHHLKTKLAPARICSHSNVLKGTAE